MRLLFVSPCFPIPIDCGQHVRTYNLIQACARRFEVTFVGPPPVSDEGREWIESVCVATRFVDSRAVDGLSAAERETLAKDLPRGGRTGYLLPYLHALRQLDPSGYDLIFTVRADLSRLLRSESDRLFVDLDDVTHLKLLKQLKVEGLTAPTVRSLVRFFIEEVVVARRLLGVSVCSHDDRRYLRRWGLGNVLVVPNGITLSTGMQRPPRSRDERPRLAFVGNMAYGANADAVRWFSSQVLPSLRKRYDGIVLDVIGPNAPDELVRELAGAVRFRGFVDDLHATLGEYDVTVAPLRFGGGTKLKVLDALAADVPLVTTPVGAEGIGLVAGVHALIAASASDFANAIVSLADDPDRAATIARQGRDFVESTFPWPAIQRRLADWLVEKVEEARRRGHGRRWLVSASELPGTPAARPGKAAAGGQSR
jgi:Glycosyltransferase